jgi:hypothetical protein
MVMLGTPDQGLHALLGELADFDAADRAAILAALSLEERDRVRRLLDDDAMPSERLAGPADLTGLSPWLAERVAASSGMTDMAHKALAQGAGEQFVARRSAPPVRSVSLLGCIAASLGWSKAR